jgi:hypothetical protein
VNQGGYHTAYSAKIKKFSLIPPFPRKSY